MTLSVALEKLGFPATERLMWKLVWLVVAGSQCGSALVAVCLAV